MRAAKHAPRDPFRVLERRPTDRLVADAKARKTIYSGRLKILGEDHSETISAAYNYANSLGRQEHFEECKSLLLKVMPVMRRVLGESDETTLRMMWSYAAVLINNPSATLDDIREAVSTLEDAGRIARRVLGGAHPTTTSIEDNLQKAQFKLKFKLLLARSKT